MSQEIQIQFDGLAADLPALTQALKTAIPDVLEVRASRWVRTDPATLKEADAGPRLDIAISYRADAEARPIVELIAAFVAASPLVVK